MGEAGSLTVVISWPLGSHIADKNILVRNNVYSKILRKALNHDKNLNINDAIEILQKKLHAAQKFPANTAIISMLN